MSSIGGREGFHDDGVVVQVVVLSYLAKLRCHMTCLHTKLSIMSYFLGSRTQIMCNKVSAKKILIIRTLK